MNVRGDSQSTSVPERFPLNTFPLFVRVFPVTEKFAGVATGESFIGSIIISTVTHEES